MSLADAAPESATAVHAIGQPLTFTFNVSNSNGALVSDAALYVNFSAPVSISSLDAQCGSGSTSVPATTAAVTCAISGGLNAPDSKSIAITVVPGFVRSLSAIALVTSSKVSDSATGNNSVTVTRNLRLLPFARQGLQAILP
jgi:hypothetical protein